MAEGLAGLGVEGAVAAADALSKPAEDYINDPKIELQWAMKAYHHAETYFNLISSVDPRRLKLTKFDDEIYAEFRKDFKDMNVELLNEDDLKTLSAKSKWRPFCNHFEGQVDDFNYGTLLRLDASNEYSEKNSILVTRIQFYAIEVARNKEGYNDCVYNKTAQKKSETSKEATTS
ncbi:protein PBDC1-like [Ptychodera flava]|uniref:protein PBDC1-like n=1 Tax=Ptychodera flava TaxID=63121 RepID=UPI00396A2689